MTSLLSRLLSRLRPRRVEDSAASPHPPELKAPEFKDGKPAPTGSPVDPSSSPAAVGLLDIVESGWYNNEAGEICPGVSIQPSDLVVDVGCGDGGAIKFCANQGASVVFLDIDEAKVRKLESQLQKTQATSARGITGTGEDIDLPSESADKVISTEVLEHVENPSQVMAELVRIGKPGALYLLTVPHEISENMMTYTAPRQYFEKPNHIRVFTNEEFHQLVRGAGLEVLRYEEFGAFWTLFFAIFWQSGSDFSQPDSPALINWAKTWHQVLKHDQGPAIKAALDKTIPNKQFILARKPGGQTN